MANITFLGMGAMGSRMALNLVNAGHNVRVWNRNSDRTLPLVEAGATAANSPREASENADFVISMLRDDEASEAAWCDGDSGAIQGMKAGAIALDCSTLTVEWVRKLSQYCAEKSIPFLDAPVAGSRPQAENAQLVFLVGGDKSSFEMAKPVLETMGSVIHHVGSNGAGACLKLAINALFGTQLATIAELLGLFKATGLDVSHAVEILSSTPVCSPAAKMAAIAMLAVNHEPMFPIDLVEKDFSYAAATAQKNGLSLPVTHSVWSTFQQARDRGFGGDNITGIAKLYNW